MSYQPERIRNVKAFLTSYMKSSSGQRALTRQPRYVEVDNELMKGRVMTGYNTIAHAFDKLVNAQRG